MKAIIIYIIPFVVGLQQICAQTVFSNGGQTLESSSSYMNFTIGETVIGNLSAGTTLISQGFQQSYPINEITDPSQTGDFEMINTNVFLYPNPVTDKLNLLCTTETESNEITGMKIYDVYGNCVRIVNIQGNTTTIDLSDLPEASYVIRIIAGNEIIGTCKITKQ
jgi:hypothetical protein